MYFEEIDFEEVDVGHTSTAEHSLHREARGGEDELYDDGVSKKGTGGARAWMDQPDDMATDDSELGNQLFDSVQREEVKLVKNLRRSLTAIQSVVEDKKMAEQAVLAYADTLHKALKFLWFPMVCLGRLPFRLLLKNHRAFIYVRRKSIPFIAFCTACGITWLVFFWITFSLARLLVILDDKNTTTTTEKISGYTSQRYWYSTFIFWTTLLQACISTTHILTEADTLATFIKEWYRVLDTSKIEVSKTLKQYIIINEMLLVLFILGMIFMFYNPEHFPHFRGTTWVIVIALGEPIMELLELDDSPDADGTFYFQKYAVIGLVVYIIVILFSWMYVIQFMVFCRCFRKGLKSINSRLAMILDVDDVQSFGPNAVRLTYEFIHKDFLGIAFTGAKIGTIYSWTMCNYYLWTIIVLVIELGEIFVFAKKDYRKVSQAELDRGEYFLDHGFEVSLPASKVVINHMLHFVTSVVCIFYVAHEGSGAHKEGKISYELARYRGLLDCSTQLERNFIRSIWIIVSDKCPVHVSPGKFFGVTNSTVMTVFATAFTYFIFWVQSRGQLGGGLQGDVLHSFE